MSAAEPMRATDEGSPAGLVKQAEYDDCYSACVASLLGLDLADVPKFYREAGGAAGLTQVPEVFGMIREWARGLGFAPLFSPAAVPLAHLLAHMEKLNPGVPYILSGQSKWGTGHSVIACYGRIIHEPMPGYGPEDGGVVAPDLDGQFQVTFFVVLPPWAGAR